MLYFPISFSKMKPVRKVFLKKSSLAVGVFVGLLMVLAGITRIFAASVVLYMTPGSQNAQPGDVKTLNIRLKTSGQKVDHGQVSIKLAPDLLTEVSYVEPSSAQGVSISSKTNTKDSYTFLFKVGLSHQDDSIIELGSLKFRVKDTSSNKVATVAFTTDSTAFSTGNPNHEYSVTLYSAFMSIRAGERRVPGAATSDSSDTSMPNNSSSTDTMPKTKTIKQDTADATSSGGSVITKNLPLAFIGIGSMLAGTSGFLMLRARSAFSKMYPHVRIHSLAAFAPPAAVNLALGKTLVPTHTDRAGQQNRADAAQVSSPSSSSDAEPQTNAQKVAQTALQNLAAHSQLRYPATAPIPKPPSLPEIVSQTSPKKATKDNVPDMFELAEAHPESYGSETLFEEESKQPPQSPKNTT